MKIMTINLHSYIEKDAEKKLELFIDGIFRIKPDILAIQEVNQRTDKEPVTNELVVGEYGIKLKADNYGLRIASELFKRGLRYNFSWVGIKRGFLVFDEGLCFLSKAPVLSTSCFLISKCDDVLNWKKRMALGIKVDNEWFYNVHMGRFDDEDEPFYEQWLRLNKKIKSKKSVWLMGDFNSPADYKNEGYDLVLKSNWYDTFALAKNKDSGHTVASDIDGWRDKKNNFSEKRIDYIFTNTKQEIASSYTIFNGTNEPLVSDHFGILITTKKEMID